VLGEGFFSRRSHTSLRDNVPVFPDQSILSNR
jgi:hypothetical protein